MSQALTAVPVEYDPFEVWHGSPHSFTAFSNGAIGSGAGDQFYGYGHYFAEHPGVAESYAEGNLYKVALNADQNKMLDLDRPFNYQHPYVQEALMKTGIHPEAVGEFNELADQSRQNGWDDEDEESTPLKELYMRTGALKAPWFSQELQDNGLHGIKYLDSFSRKASPENQTRNFVLFDPTRAQILEHNGQPVVSRAEVAAAGHTAIPVEGNPFTGEATTTPAFAGGTLGLSADSVAAGGEEAKIPSDKIVPALSSLLPRNLLGEPE